MQPTRLRVDEHTDDVPHPLLGIEVALQTPVPSCTFTHLIICKDMSCTLPIQHTDCQSVAGVPLPIETRSSLGADDHNDYHRQFVKPQQ